MQGFNGQDGYPHAAAGSTAKNHQFETYHLPMIQKNYTVGSHLIGE